MKHSDYSFSSLVPAGRLYQIYTLNFFTSVFGFAMFIFSGNNSQAAATTGASWGYDGGGVFQDSNVNSAVFEGNMSTIRGSVSNVTAVSEIAVSASQGEIHLLNEFAFAFARGKSHYGYGHVGGGFDDTLLISDSTRAVGERGVYFGSIRVDLNYMGSQPYTSVNSFGVGIGSTMGNARAASQNVFFDNGGVSTYAYLGFGPGNAQSFNNQILNFSVPFTFNEAFGIGVWVESELSTRGTGYVFEAAVSRSHDASNTVEWAGTVSVMDANGTVEPSSYSLTSGSGTDYVNAVPEPSSVALLIASLAFGACALARRRQAR